MMKLTTEDKEKNSGLIGKYKSEIDSDTILMGVIALQKKCYCLLLIKQFKCPLCQKYSALCECVVNYQGKPKRESYRHEYSLAEKKCKKKT